MIQICRYPLERFLFILAWVFVVAGCESDDRSGPVDPADTTAPAAIRDLALDAATTVSVTLTWTAPGDDGDRGTADHYDLRFSFDSTATWASMTPYPLQSKAKSAGSRETATIINLAVGAQYDFEIRTHDDVSNVSLPSNRLRASTAVPPDVTPPGTVRNLAVKYATESTLTLGWGTVGDDNIFGGAPALYDLRIATNASTPWEDMTPVDGEPIPQAYGTGEVMAVRNLEPLTAYYFRLRVADEVPNWSEVSNAATGATLAAGEICGTIAGDTRWTVAESPYRLTCDVFVTAGTLTIDPGVEVVVPENFVIERDATLIADGTMEAPIRFSGDGQIRFGGTHGRWDNDSTWASGSLMRHCTVDLPLECTTTPAFIRCTFHGNDSQAGLLWIRGDDLPEVRLYRCIVEDHVGFMSPIHLAARRALILLDCILRNNSSPGSGNAGGALTLSGGGWCTVRNCRFTGNRSGYGATVAIYGMASVFIECSEFSGNEGGLRINFPAQSEAAITVRNCNLTNPDSREIYNQSLNTLRLGNNWWGTTDSLAVLRRIRDCRNADGTPGCALIQPLRTGPVTPGGCGP